MEAYTFYPGKLPLLISIPHAGTALTPWVEKGLSPAARTLPDTDWHIPQLYEFVHQLGANVLVANYSRFVVDLNRPIDDAPLYQTATTGLHPEQLFDGTPIFLPNHLPTPVQRAIDRENVWLPYHQKIQTTLAELKKQFGYVILFDAHSIASQIPRLFTGQLPDLNLGTNDGKSCSAIIAEQLTNACHSQSQFSWVINGRFKGGYITRTYGQPDQQQHAVQLELAQQNYMDEHAPYAWNQTQAETLRPQLMSLIEACLTGAKLIYPPSPSC
jgi:formiminoglutamase